MVVAAVFGAVVLLVASIAFVGRDGGGDPQISGPTSTTTLEEPTPTTAPTTTGPPPTEEQLEALVDELQAYVAEVRELDFLEDVVVELADDAAFEARLLENFEDDLDQIEQAEVFYRALGLIEPETSLLDILRSIYSSGVLGFYDPETNELVVRGRELTPYVQQTVVHELVHALDDQHFELFREHYDDRDDEIGTGFTAVVEGNARRIENGWLDTKSDEFRAEADAEEQAFAAGIDVDAFPEILLFEIGAPYELGEVFVGRILERGGERAVDAAITEPPDTSEQVLFPPLYFEGEPRIEVPPPPAGGPVVDEGVVGALFLFGLLVTGDSPVGEVDAMRAVQGWGGDWAVTWTEGDAACVRADVVGDTDQDTDEIEVALTEWAEESAVASVDVVDGRVRVESCSSGGGAVPPEV